MCDITNVKSKTKVGYKVLAYDKDTKKFYSTFTGQEIGIGKVPLPPVRCKRLSYAWLDSLDDQSFKHSRCFKPEFVGKTSAFLSKYYAMKLRAELESENHDRVQYQSYRSLTTLEFIVVKITFTGDVYEGLYSDTVGIISVIAGDTIESIEIVD